jgi:hypothetical protein
MSGVSEPVQVLCREVAIACWRSAKGGDEVRDILTTAARYGGNCEQERNRDSSPHNVMPFSGPRQRVRCTGGLARGYHGP